MGPRSRARSYDRIEKLSAYLEYVYTADLSLLVQDHRLGILGRGFHRAAVRLPHVRNLGLAR